MRFILALVCLLAGFLAGARAQASWDFTAGTGAPTSLAQNISGGMLTGGNFASGALAFNNTSPSNYTGASAGNNAAIVAKTGALNSATSTYIEFTLTAAPNVVLNLSSVKLGSRSTSTGPTKVTVHASTEGFATALATATVPATSTWTAVTLTGFNITSNAGGAVTVRIYGSEGAGSVSGANWRIDDLAVKSDQTISFGALADRVMGDTPFSVNASATSGLAPTFSIVSGPATASGANNSTITVTGVGTVVVRAVQPGDTNWNAAPNVDRSFAVTATAIAPAITTQPVAQTATVGASVTLNAAASGTGPLHFQWKHGTTNVGADDATLVLNNITTADAGSYSVAVTNSAGAANSQVVMLTVNQAAQTIAFGALANKAANDPPFTLNATASSGLAVQFAIVSGPATISGNTLTLTGNSGTVVVRASQPGNADYLAAPAVERSFTVTPLPVAPTFTQQPVNVTVALGAEATLSAIATGYPLPSYQWRKDGVALPGATQATFTLAQVSASDAGAYVLAATNSLGTATSQTVTLGILRSAQSITFNAPAESHAFGSVVTLTATATSGLPVQFSLVSGAASLSGNRLVGNSATVIVRASQPGNVAIAAATPVERTFTFISPGMAPFLTSPPADQTVVAGSPVTFFVSALGTPAPSYQWQKNGVPIAGATQATFVIANSALDDAANYTVIATNFAGSVTATARLTVNAAPTFERAPVPTDPSEIPANRGLVNLSTRGVVRPGEPLIAGFAIVGPASQRVLIRGVGPTLALAPIALADALANPQLTLFRGSTALKSNDDWFRDSDAPSIRDAAAKVGAFALGATSLDAALLVSLEPGAYTVQVSAAGDAANTGVALLEIYATQP